MRALALWLALALVACASRPSAQLGGLTPSHELAPPFVVQQKLHGRHGERALSLDVVVQLSAGKLTLVGLTPFGSRAFVLEQVGTTIKLEKVMPGELPLDPQRVLADVHRVFFRGFTSPQADGEHVRVERGERIRERWQQGVLVERRFEPLEGTQGTVVVRFEGAPAPVIAPRVWLENPTFGYLLRIENIAQQRLAN